MKITVEGTAHEIAATFPNLIQRGAPSAGDEGVEKDVERDGAEQVYVSVPIARLVLGRRPLSKEQKLVLQTIYHAHLEWVPATELQKKVGYTPQEFAGLMGAFGRRLTHTSGYSNNTCLFEQIRDPNLRCWKYRLPESVREALRLERIV